MLYNIKVKTKYIFTYVNKRFFSSSEVFIRWYLDRKGGKIKTSNNGWIVNQSNAFHEFCYSTGYNLWKKENNL